jgi:uncharacterized membrane protein
VAGIFVAIPSGAGVAIALTGGISSTLVGVAISAALLPPIANSGMCVTVGVLEVGLLRMRERVRESRE